MSLLLKKIFDLSLNIMFLQSILLLYFLVSIKENKLPCVLRNLYPSSFIQKITMKKINYNTT